MVDISNLIGSTGVALEAQAYKTFGAAVENQANGILGNVFGSASTPGQPAVNGIQNGVFDPTPYASALTNFSGGFDPKSKFLFKVHFKFDSYAQQMASSMGVNVSDISRDVSFTIKQIDLPKVKFDYQEVNMYNFKTKVLKGISHDALNFTFYDDKANHALSFVNIYMQIVSPITRNLIGSTVQMEDHGFAFNPLYNGLDTGSRGSITGGTRKDILESLTIEQYYVNMSQSSNNSVTNLVRINSFTFINPRLAEFNIQDQNHETGSEASTITASFDYDALHIATGGDPAQAKSDEFPGGDIMHGFQTTAATIKRSQSQEGNAQNPFMNIISQQTGRAIQTTVSNALQGTFGTVAGGALSNAISTISGTLGQKATSTLMSATGNVNQSIAVPSSPIVTDNAGTTTPPTQVSSDTPPTQ